jgi:hypothetical protein
VIFGVVRRKVNAARAKVATIVSAILLTSLFVSIPVPAQAAECVKSSTTVSGETVLTFSTVGTCEWTVPAGVTSARVLVVGGGSSGGSGQAGVWWPQGGAGGAVIDNQSFTVAPGASISIVIGGGGAKVDAHSNPANNGGRSSFATIIAMVELHQIIPWHPVVLAVMEILAVHQQVNMFQVVAVVLVVLVTEQPAALALTQISLAQHLCTAAAVLDQMDQQEVHLQAAAPMAIHQRQVEVAVVHRPRQVLHLHLQVRMA